MTQVCCTATYQTVRYVIDILQACGCEAGDGSPGGKLLCSLHQDGVRCLPIDILFEQVDRVWVAGSLIPEAVRFFHQRNKGR